MEQLQDVHMEPHTWIWSFAWSFMLTHLTVNDHLSWETIEFNGRFIQVSLCHGPLARYVKLIKSCIVHALGIPGTFSPPPRVSDPDTHHGMCVTHVSRCMPESLTNGFLWNRWQGKRSRHSRCMRNAWFYVSDKRTMLEDLCGEVGLLCDRILHFCRGHVVNSYPENPVVTILFFYFTKVLLLMFFLTRGLVTHRYISNLSHKRFRLWPAVCSDAKHYLNQY